MSSERYEVYHPSLNRSMLAVVDETKLRHTKLCTGLQGFTCFDVVGRVSAVLMG